MGIAKSQFENILSNIFKAGNTIKLYSTMPSESTESGGVLIGSGTADKTYTIQSGDFTCAGGTAQSAKNMMMYLCETTGGDGTAVGFGVFSGSTLLYFGQFSTAMYVDYNTVPTIKRYDATKGEGVLITMTSTDVSA